MIGALLALAFVVTLGAQQTSTPPEVTVGREGQYLLRYDGPALEARPASHESSLLVRIAEVTDTDAGRLYDLRYIGTRPGKYDLAAGLRHLDGSDVVDAEKMPIKVVSVLPADHQGDLEELTPPPAPRGNVFRALFVLVALAWLIPLIFFMKRLMTRRPKARAMQMPTPEPTFADQLRPLVEAAARQELALDDKIRLERLLIAHWRSDDSRPDNESHAETLQRLRATPDIGPLLSGVERWLHGPPTQGDVDVSDLLAPFTRSRPVTEATP